MNMTTSLIMIAFIAWGIQIVFSWFQIHRFNRAFLALKKGTYLGVGRSKTNHFKPRVLIAISLDENQIIIDSILMKGLTVFALPKPISKIHGLSATEIIPEKIFPNDFRSQNALAIALTVNK